MSRIIPWNLPSVTGGSIGGYTPAPTPEPPEDKKFFDFTSVDVDYYGTSNTIVVYFPNTSINTTSKNLTVSSIIGTLSGVTEINLVGVSSVSILVTASLSDPYVGGVQDLILSMDPITKAMTFVSGTIDIKRTSGSASLNNQTLKITEYKCVVYNGNGEIIQEDTIEVSP